MPLGVPLLPPNEFTTAVRLLRDGCEENVRVKEVAVAEVTRPVPLLKVTVLLSGVFALNPVPVMVRVVAFIPRLVVVLVTVGAATILATWTGAPLETPLAVTTAVKNPTVVGCVVKATVN